MSPIAQRVMQFVFVLFALAISACASLSDTASPRVIFDEVIVLNNTDRPIKDFKVMNTVTHRYFGCSVILPDSSCSIAFSKREGQNNPVIIAWIEKGQQVERALDTQVIPSDRVTKKVYITLLPGGAFTSQIR